MMNYIRPSMRYFNHVLQELEVRNLTARTVAGKLSSLLYQQVSKRSLFDPDFQNCSNHCSAVNLVSMFGILSSSFFVTNRH